jgi:peptidoglycan biosynthesis protein MviN/MurJ (putative lipid II flippase)
MDNATIGLIVGGIVQIIVALIAGWAAVASRRAEKAANHGNKKIAELQEQLLKMNKRVRAKAAKARR